MGMTMTQKILAAHAGLDKVDTYTYACSACKKVYETRTITSKVNYFSTAGQFYNQWAMDGKGGTCTTAGTCERCKAKEPEFGHKFSAATCTDAAVCSVCGEYGDEALGEVKEYLSEIDFVPICRRAIDKKYGGIPTDLDIRKKCIDYLLRQGFSYNEIKKAFDANYGE